MKIGIGALLGAVLGGTWHDVWVYKASGKTAQLACGCVVSFVDGIERRIKEFPGIGMYEVDRLQACRKKQCHLRFNRPDGCYYLPFSYQCKDPDDPLAAELAKQFLVRK